MKFKIVCFFFVLIVSVSSEAALKSFQNCPSIDSDPFKMAITFNCRVLGDGVNHKNYFDAFIKNDSCTFKNPTDLIPLDRKIPLSRAFRIDFKNCQLPNIPRKFLHRLLKVKNIHLDYAGVKAIDGEVFPIKNELKVLSMTHNELSALPGLLFLSTPQIEDVNFAHNKIHAIDASIFGSATKKLRKIKLAHNLLETMDEQLFANLNNLIEIDLSYNLIATFPLKLHTAINLSALNLNNNKLTRLDCDFFVRSVVNDGIVINVSANEINEIDLNCDTTHIGWNLKVEDNLLESLTFPESQLVSGLQSLSASGNKIKHVLIENDLKNLKHFNVSNNQLKSISNMSSHCVALESLDLSSNAIGQLSANHFSKMPKLLYLNLSNMNVSVIEFGTFAHQRNLVELDLSRNKLMEFDFELFLPYFEHLTALRLNNNQLTKLDGHGWDPKIFPNLKVLAVDNNKLFCENLRYFFRQFPNGIDLPIDDDVTVYTNQTSSIYGVNCVFASSSSE